MVLPGKAADEVGAVDAAGGGAALDHAGGKVIAGDAAHDGRAGGHALKAAVVQRAGVLPARPPTVVRLPVGMARPRTTRSRTLASFWT